VVKRISRGVRRRPEISEAAKLLAEALKLRDHREDAIDDDRSCPGRGRCGTCDHYEELVAKIANILGLSVDEVHPIDVGDIEPPPWWELNQIEAWEGARRLYVDLCAAGGVEPQRRLSMREFDEGQITVRWIERMCPVPGGLVGSGEPLRLRDWQRAVVKKIYGSTGKKIRDVLDGIDPAAS
jgi:hypothetical protein